MSVKLWFIDFLNRCSRFTGTHFRRNLENNEKRHVIYPKGKPMIPYLLCCRGLDGPAPGGAASPLTSWICGILDFCNVRERPAIKPLEFPQNIQ